ncbi:MAG: D-aminopeptidase [Planctomycetota bacterium]
MADRFLALLLIFGAWTAVARAADGDSLKLPRSSPEAQGISSKAILEFVQAADQQIAVMNSVMLVRHGHVVAEGWWAPYDSASRHELYSLSKSFTSTAVGMAIAEGKLSLDDEVLKFFPDSAPAEPSRNLKSMRVRDLLSMSTGHQTEPRLPAGEPTWVKTFLAHEVPHKPGAHFMYNTPATYMLSAIVQKQTGETVLEYLRPRLFDPLGIDDPTWGKCPGGITLGGYGLNVRTEDIAKFGQLYLQQGMWYGKPLLTPAWVAMATGKQTSNGSNPQSDWDQGYGFQFWRSRNECYRGDGAFGQYCIVMPKQDAVLAITSGVKDMQAVLNLVWDKLLPAMKGDALPADAENAARLQSAMKSLVLPYPAGDAKSKTAVSISGRRFQFTENAQGLDTLSIETSGPEGQVTLVSRSNGKEQRLVCGHKQWMKGRFAWGVQAEQPVAASGAWVDDETFSARIYYVETPFSLTLRMKFADQELTLDTEANVGFGPTVRPQLKGKRLADN